MAAVVAGCLESIDFMHRVGVHLNQRDTFGETPAHKAARAQHWRTVRILITLLCPVETMAARPVLPSCALACPLGFQVRAVVDTEQL